MIITFYLRIKNRLLLFWSKSADLFHEVEEEQVLWRSNPEYDILIKLYQCSKVDGILVPTIRGSRYWQFLWVKIVNTTFFQRIYWILWVDKAFTILKDHIFKVKKKIPLNYQNKTRIYFNTLSSVHLSISNKW